MSRLIPAAKDYRVAWVCAVQTEYTIACAFLDHEFPTPTLSSRDDNVYTCGRIEGHNVVIACLPKGKYGTISAAGVARDLMRSFEYVKHGLMVGIAGGAPLQKDIRLGDIVIGCPGDTHNGVLNYTSGKNIQGQRTIKLQGSLNAPPRILLAAVQKLGAQYEANGHQLDAIIVSKLASKPRLQRSHGRPRDDQDRLYNSKFIHPREAEACNTCCPSRGSQLIHRPPRAREDRIMIHTGLIACADQLMKNATIRDRLSEDRNVLCFEMEAAGLMDHFPCLVIRGICDYSDTHKNDEWQGYAAATAAAYAKELLRVLPPTVPIDGEGSNHSSTAKNFGLFHLCDSSSKSRAVDIIAVHGLGGDAYESWTDQDERMWLSDLLPYHVKQARVWTYGYDSMKAFNGQKSNIMYAALELLEHLKTLRSGESNARRNIVFICHGLGGVLVRLALSLANEVYRKFLANSCYGIAYLGTPQQDLSVDEWTSLLNLMAETLLMSMVDRISFFSNAEALSQTLVEVTRNKAPYLQQIATISFYEQAVFTETDQVLVPRAIATSGTAREKVVPIDLDHQCMSKLSSVRRGASNLIPIEIVRLANEIQSEETIRERAGRSESSISDNTVRVNLLNKLYCVDHVSMLTSITEAAPGTGNWLKENAVFRLWVLDDDPVVFHLTGPPGHGKSVIAAKTIHDIKSGQIAPFRNEKCTVIYFIFNKLAPESSLQVTFLRSLLHQALQQHPNLTDVISQNFETSSEKARRSMVDPHQQVKLLWDTVQVVLMSHLKEPIVVVIDALDEADDKEISEISAHLLSLFQTLHSMRNGIRVKLFLTSRPDEKIIAECHDKNTGVVHPCILHVELEPGTMSKDVEAFLDQTVTAFGHRNEFLPLHIAKIKEAIAMRAEGMYLWAKLAWDDFKKDVVIWDRRTINQRLEGLKKLPRGIEALYAALLSKVDRAAWKQLSPLIMYVTVAMRRLSCDEAGQILGLTGDEKNTEQIDDPFAIRKTISRYFSTLLKINPGGTIDFVHVSLKEYFMETRYDDIAKYRIRIAKKCLHYLRLDDIQAAARKDHTDKICLMENTKFRLYEYASNNLPSHMRYVPADDNLWLAYGALAKDYHYYHVISTSSHIYHVINKYTPVEARDFQVRTPLRNALRFQKYNVVKRLVANGYDINEKEQGKPPIFGVFPDEDAIAALLDSGYDPNTRDSTEQTVLHLATIASRTELIKLLLSVKGTDVNAQDAEGKTPLHHEIMNLTDSTDSLIIADKRVNVDVADNSGRTAMGYVIYWGNWEAASKLVSNPQFLLSHSKDTLSPMVSAAIHEWKDITSIMLDQITDVDSHRSYSGKTVVHLAVINSWPDILRQAFGRNANLNIQDNQGKTPLHYAAELGDFKLARDLIRLKATARIKDRLGRTAVHAAAIEGFADTMLPLLLESDYDINACDDQKRSVAYWAATCDYVHVIRAVIENPDVDLTKKDHHGRNALHAAALCGCPNVIAELLKLKIYNVTETDAFGNTLLHLAARAKNLSSLELLLPELELHKNRVNKWGQTALGTADVYGAGPEVLQLLRSAGVRHQARPSNISNFSPYNATNKGEHLISTVHNQIMIRPRSPDSDPDSGTSRRIREITIRGPK